MNSRVRTPGPPEPPFQQISMGHDGVLSDWTCTSAILGLANKLLVTEVCLWVAAAIRLLLTALTDTNTCLLLTLEDVLDGL